MIMVTKRGGWVIALSFILAIALTILPLPDWSQPFRPNWAALILIYWCMALPDRVGIGIAWIVGILLDTASGTLLGQHSLGMILIAYVVIRLHRQLRVYPLRQQSLTIFILLAIGELVSLWINGLTGHPTPVWHLIGASLLGMLLWPWIYFLLRDLRRRFKVS